MFRPHIDDSCRAQLQGSICDTVELQITGWSGTLTTVKRELKQLRRRRSPTTSKNNRFNDQNNSSAHASRFLVHFFDVTARPATWNLLIWLLWGTWTYDDEFSFLFLNLNKILENSTPGKVACIWRHIERVQIDMIKFERTQIHFFSYGFTAVVVVVVVVVG